MIYLHVCTSHVCTQLSPEGAVAKNVGSRLRPSDFKVQPPLLLTQAQYL